MITNRTLVLMQGLPGSGKSTLISRMMEERNMVRNSWIYSRFKEEEDAQGKDVIICSVDDYFTDKLGDYNFKPEKLADAHKDCQERVKAAMTQLSPKGVVFVDNTNMTREEARPYVDLAHESEHVFSVVVVVVHDPTVTDEFLAARNTHGVSVETIAAMRARMERLHVLDEHGVFRDADIDAIMASKAP